MKLRYKIELRGKKMKKYKNMTSTVYVINNDKVLLHRHKKYNSLFPVGGHLEEGELPQETALREVKEEAGLEVKLWESQKKLGLSRVKQLINPQYTLLENIGQEVENIDFIFFATTDQVTCNPENGESKEFYWLTAEEIEKDMSIKEHIKVMALEALNTIKTN